MSPRRPGLEPTMVCVKNLILGMNCMLVMTGILLIGVGSTIKGLYDHFDSIIGSNIISPADFLLVVGIIIFFVAVFGCLGAFRESTFLLNMYTVSLIIIFIFEISAGIAGFALQSTIRGTLNDNLLTAIKDYPTNNETHDAIDFIQRGIQCCGANSVEDWNNTLSMAYNLNTENNIVVPDSCCRVRDEEDSLKCTTLYEEGCLEALVYYSRSGAALLTGVALTVALIQALGIYFSNELAVAIRRVKSLRTMRQMEIRNNLVATYEPMSKTEPTSQTPVVYLSTDISRSQT